MGVPPRRRTPTRMEHRPYPVLPTSDLPCSCRSYPARTRPAPSKRTPSPRVVQSRERCQLPSFCLRDEESYLIVPPLQGPLDVVVPDLQPGDQLLMVGNHRLQRLIRPLLEGGHSLLHLKTLRRQTKDICLCLLHLTL